MKILVLNSGSSSQKSCLYEINHSPPSDPPACVWAGKIEWQGDTSSLSISGARGLAYKEHLTDTSRVQALEDLIGRLWKGPAAALSSPSELDVVGHRIVYGGAEYQNPVQVTPEVKSTIASLTALAPLHSRAELEGMEIVERLFGSIPQIAVFDTAFHHTMPLSSAVYPGPYEWFTRGIRRFGFHGINHAYCAERAAHLLRRDLSSFRLVTCHLGNGCSLAAIKNGRSIDTTMGFTPLEGLMMGTRSGSIDPGIVTYLMRHDHLSAEQLDDLLNSKSGLLGISRRSADMRDILAAIRTGDERAKLAFDIYIHRLQAGIGSMVAVLDGLDALVFTAGVGENSSEVRSACCSNLEFLGLKLDPDRNAHSPADANIAAPKSRVPVLVIRAQEDWRIARDCWTALKGNKD
jgi:acetate kinase